MEQSNQSSVPFDAMQCSHIYCYCLYSYEYSLYQLDSPPSSSGLMAAGEKGRERRREGGRPKEGREEECVYVHVYISCAFICVSVYSKLTIYCTHCKNISVILNNEPTCTCLYMTTLHMYTCACRFTVENDGNILTMCTVCHTCENIRHTVIQFKHPYIGDCCSHRFGNKCKLGIYQKKSLQWHIFLKSCMHMQKGGRNVRMCMCRPAFLHCAVLMSRVHLLYIGTQISP